MAGEDGCRRGANRLSGAVVPPAAAYLRLGNGRRGRVPPRSEPVERSGGPARSRISAFGEWPARTGAAGEMSRPSKAVAPWSERAERNGGTAERIDVPERWSRPPPHI